MLLPLTKRAGVVSSTIGVLSHPATAAAAPIIAAGLPIVADAVKKKEQEPPPVQQPMTRVGHLLPGFVVSIYKRAGLIDGAAKLLAKPAVQVAMAVGPTALGMLGNKAPAGPSGPAAPKTGPEGTHAAPSGAFSRPQQQVTASVMTTAQGPVDMTQPVVPAGPAPSTRGAPSPTAHVDGSSQGSPTTSSAISTPKAPKLTASAPKAFKVGSLLDSPKLKQYLDLGSQAAVIGSAAIPAYQMWAEHQRNKGREEMNGMDPAMEMRALQTARQPQQDPMARVASMLPLQPKQPILHRIGDGIKDFGEGAYDELDNQAGKLLQTTNRLDPIKTRTPSLLPKI